MAKFAKKLLTVAAVGAGATGGVTWYFYRRTMMRGNANVERTIKMAGTDWNQYADLLAERKEAFLAQPHEDVYIESNDGLHLHATYFPQDGEKKTALCFHGYTSQGMKDYIALSDYYFRHGYSLLLPDARAHGDSGGEYVGFGCLDRWDGMKWIDWLTGRQGEDTRILLHGTSMGGATVLMMSGLQLPEQVKGIISDCAFTSAKEVFTHVLNSMYHMPAWPIIPLSDAINHKLAGYGMDECNAAREVKKAKVPILFIHGSADTFVPVEMCERMYEACASPKQKLIVEGAAHAESYYKDMAAYEEAMDAFLQSVYM